LRYGVEVIGLKQKLPLAQFKPALAMNPEILARYGANPPAGGAAGSLLAPQ
jgi:type I restriction enzyme, R subunit